MNRAGGVLAVALALGLAPGTANAEPGLWNGSTCAHPATVIGDPGGCSPAGSTCSSDPAGTCLYFAGGFSLCIPDTTGMFCCATENDCPSASDGAGSFTCVTRTGLTDAGLCLDLDNDYCTDTDPVPGANITRCHTGRGGVTVAWAEGDCDGDGLANGEEEDAGTDPCAVPVRRAAWDGSGACVELPTSCIPDEACTTPAGPGTCDTTSDSSGTRCYPDSEAVLFCGDGPFECPDDVEVVDRDRMHTWCIPDVCADETTGLPPIACILDGSGAPTSWDEGDCDGDGIPNIAETNEGICVPDGSPPEDAGTGSGDAGTTPPPDVDPEFEGGGGCACPASVSGANPSGGWLALIVIGAFLWRRRR